MSSVTSAPASASASRTVASADGIAALTRIGFAPIVRVDAERREVELCATSEAIDSYDTIFDYAASKDAFSRWIGNVPCRCSLLFANVHKFGEIGLLRRLFVPLCSSLFVGVGVKVGVNQLVPRS